jgi:hypothetical protein
VPRLERLDAQISQAVKARVQRVLQGGFPRAGRPQLNSLQKNIKYTHSHSPHTKKKKKI